MNISKKLSIELHECLTVTDVLTTLIFNRPVNRSHNSLFRYTKGNSTIIYKVDDYYNIVNILIESGTPHQIAIVYPH